MARLKSARGAALAALLLSAGIAGCVSGAGSRTGGSRWVATWAASPQPFLPGRLKTFRNQTVRLVVHTSVGGQRLRLRLSNTYGDGPVAFGAVRVARRTAGADIEPTSDRGVTFAGSPAVTIPSGATVVSDAVELPTPALSDLAVSLYFPDETPARTDHLLALQHGFVAAEAGDRTSLAAFASVKRIDSWPFLTGVDVQAAPRSAAAAVVVFGDSWVDGDGSTPDANHRLPDFLAERLQREPAGRRFGVANAGIIGNRLLRDSPREPPSPFGAALGESGLARLERDALGQPGVEVIIVRFGVNDLALPGTVAPAAEAVTAADLIAGFQKVVAIAHRRGVHVVGTTITPFENATTAPGYYTAEKEAVRQQVNAWIRKSPDFDGVADLDFVVRDPNHPARLLPAYDSGDHLHANDAGYAAAANAIPLESIPAR